MAQRSKDFHAASNSDALALHDATRAPDRRACRCGKAITLDGNRQTCVDQSKSV
ncbi:protein of unknown function [Bradyrhizobium vignae]|uniref:Uncharacterized protein n=1 Tax=Bradyrhizobium vignae TaxID=1549949 RepID=A0A2U3Q158_9BRAD|nr:protein of unknown function [Bradyrhizobium vignae]